MTLGKQGAIRRILDRTAWSLPGVNGEDTAMRRMTVAETPREDDLAEDNRVTRSLAGLVVALSLVVASLFLIQTLGFKAQVEDCLLAGRGNCDAVVAGGR